MAYTVSKVNVNLGSINGVLCEVSADAASGNWTVPMGSISGWVLGAKSMNSGAIKIASSGQTVTVSNATNGDNFFIMVYGK